MDLNIDYYNILGVNKNSSEEEIKKSFRKKANETHPDKHGGDDKDFKKINDAYQILNNKDKKRQYDIQSPYGNNYNPNSGGFNNFFNNAFGGFNVNFENNSFDPFEMFFNRRSEFIENLDIQLNININLKDIYNNKEINIKYDRNVTCNVCNGTGFDPNSNSYQCDVCDGNGFEWRPPFGKVECKYCQGKGRIHTGTCKKCNGEKIINKKENFVLNNVYKIIESDVKYLKGYGHQSKHYINKKGVLILNIIYNDDNKYIRKSDGLYHNLDIHYEDAINGIDINYKHLDDKIYKLKIPKKTKDGDKLKMNNKGLLINNNNRQNLYLLINIIIDYNRINI